MAPASLEWRQPAWNGAGQTGRSFQRTGIALGKMAWASDTPEWNQAERPALGVDGNGAAQNGRSFQWTGIVPDSLVEASDGPDWRRANREKLVPVWIGAGQPGSSARSFSSTGSLIKFTFVPPIRVFLSYSHVDEAWKDRLSGHLAVLTEEGVLDVWDDRRIGAGATWEAEIRAAMDAAEVAILLISKDFLTSRFVRDSEVPHLLQRRAEEGLRVIPVIVHPCLWKEAAWLAALQVRPRNGTPLAALRGSRVDKELVALAKDVLKPPPGHPEGELREREGSGGRKGAAHSDPLERRVSPQAKPWARWASGLVLLAALSLTAWLWPRPPEKPALYSVRVQVLDPQGHPVDGSKIRTSTGNEPHLLPDGWWEIQIPAAKVPADGRVTLWAEHKDWEGNHRDLTLASDPNPQVQIPLKQPETWIRGRVVDGDIRGLAGVRVSRQDGTPGFVVTDAEGVFALRYSGPPGPRVGLRVERKGSAPEDKFCYAGTDGCSITLEK
jgi:hypothetical protein